MSKPGSEERYPLLLLYVEENGKKSEFPQRVVFADKGRGKEISNGVAAIFTQWPAQITSCWLTSIAIGTAFIFVSLLLLMSSLNPMSFPVQPRCERDVSSFPGNKTIHLVKHGNNWNHKQLDLLSFIAETYPDFEIRNIMLETSFKNFKKREKKRNDVITTTTTEMPSHFHFMHIPDFSSMFIKKLNEIIMNDNINLNKRNKEEVRPIENIKENALNSTVKRIKRHLTTFKFSKTYEDILQTHPNIKEEKTIYKQYFSNSPLQYFWMDLNPEMLIFSVRVLELWQNGGISFSLPSNQNKNILMNNYNLTSNRTTSNETRNIIFETKNHFEDNINIPRLKLMITSTKYRYDKIAEDSVSVDGQGLHMATKTPCHSFFGEMIIKLQKDIENLSVSAFIQRILNTFCSRGAVDSDYCMKKKK